jgi:hypothetical protein
VTTKGQFAIGAFGIAKIELNERLSEKLRTIAAISTLPIVSLGLPL